MLKALKYIWSEYHIFIVFIILSLFFLVPVAYTAYNTYKQSNMDREKLQKNVEEFPEGTIVHHKINLATGVVVGHSPAYIKVRFINEYAGLQPALECLKQELQKTQKTIGDLEEKKDE